MTLLPNVSLLLGCVTLVVIAGCFHKVDAIRQPLGFDSPMPSSIKQPGWDGAKPQLTISAFVNYGGDVLPMGPICTEGVAIALEAIANASLLSDYQLVVELHDDKMCEENLGVKLVADVLNSAKDNTNNLVPLIIGPTCAQNEFTGSFIKYYNFVGLADASIILETYTNRVKYDSFDIMTPTLAIFYNAIPPFLKSNDWSQVFLLTETFSVWSPLEDILQYNMAKWNISLAGTAKVLAFGDALPAMEHFETAVRDLAAMDPRIVIVNTHFGALVACWLHRFRLYGAGYVYLFFGPSFFLPNSHPRLEGCTDEMLADVLSSVIYFSTGTPINMNADTAVDILGMTGKKFERTLKERINHPEMNDKWFFWRSHCYSETLAAVLVLNHTESKLQEQNDTLLNWVTNSENFRQNGTYIHSLFRDFLAQFHYEGLNTFDDDDINSVTGITGFFQMQRSNKTADIFETVPVAKYDSQHGEKAKIVLGPGNYVWRTSSGAPPYDAVRIVPSSEPIINMHANVVLLCMGALLWATNFVFLALYVTKIKTPAVANSLPTLNILILVGNLLITLFVLVSPVGFKQQPNVNCIAASWLLISGFSLINGAIFGKLSIAHGMFSNLELQTKQLRSQSRSPTCRTVTFHLSPEPTAHVSPSRFLEVRPKSAMKKTNLVEFSIPKASKRCTVAVLLYSLLQAVLAAVWFDIEPIRSKKVILALDSADNDSGIARQHFTYQCQLAIRSHESLFVIVPLVACYLIIVFFSTYLSISLRKASSLLVDSAVNDVNFFRVASYATNLIIMAGAAVLYAFFRNEAAMLQLASSVLDIIVVFMITSLIFFPKLRRGYLL